MNHEAYKRKLWAMHLASLPAEMPEAPEAAPGRAQTRELADNAAARWKRRNREHVCEYHKKWRAEHPVTDEERAEKRRHDRERYRNDPEYRERKKAQQKARRARIKSDPVAYAALLERERAERRRHREKVLAERGAA